MSIQLRYLVCITFLTITYLRVFTWVGEFRQHKHGKIKKDFSWCKIFHSISSNSKENLESSQYVFFALIFMVMQHGPTITHVIRNKNITIRTQKDMFMTIKIWHKNNTVELSNFVLKPQRHVKTYHLYSNYTEFFSGHSCISTYWAWTATPPDVYINKNSSWRS